MTWISRGANVSYRQPRPWNVERNVFPRNNNRPNLSTKRPLHCSSRGSGVSITYRIPSFSDFPTTYCRRSNTFRFFQRPSRNRSYTRPFKPVSAHRLIVTIRARTFTQNTRTTSGFPRFAEPVATTRFRIEISFIITITRLPYFELDKRTSLK